MDALKSKSAARYFVPEVVQTSALDCGPASLKALLEGFGIAIDYSRLREACQTDVDGTSIDVLEDVAGVLGLEAGQYIVPLDHLLMAETEALPGIVVTALPNGLTHFVVAWRMHKTFVQIMDPARGRQFKPQHRFLRDVFAHRFPVPADTAGEWFHAPAFIAPLRRRLADLQLSPGEIDDLLNPAISSPEWFPLAAIDAATRLVTRLVQAHATKKGIAAKIVVQRLVDAVSREGAHDVGRFIPLQYWTASRLPTGDVELRGAVIVHAEGKTSPEKRDTEKSAQVSPELSAALRPDTPRPIRSILDAALEVHRLEFWAIPFALLLAGGATAIEGLVLGGLAGVHQAHHEHLSAQRAIWFVFLFIVIALLLNLSTSALLMRLGRWLDLHLRIRLLEKLPRLGNYYFHSRLTSDLAQRAHELRSLRSLPEVVGNIVRTISEIVLAAVGLVWLVPDSTVFVLFAVLVILGLPMALLPLLSEQDLRRETHVGVLIRFQLDALLGHSPIKTHNAEQAVRAEHENLLVQWAAATRAFYWTHLGGLVTGTLASTFFAIWALNHFAQQESRTGIELLVFYWVLKLPLLSQGLGTTLRQLPALQNRLRRLFDVLHGPEEAQAHQRKDDVASSPITPDPHGVKVAFHDVTVVAAGQSILENINLEIEAGEHVAIVGSSGSGKTSLVGTLLGWHRPAQGALRFDGQPMDSGRIEQLRRQTAWVDPAVQLWNRSLDENLRYGNGTVPQATMDAAIESAELKGVVERLPEGLQTRLGEGGGLVSGGEGQRIRFARALLRPDVRLVILDEPFRGLEHDRRRALLAEARRHWSKATLLYVSHDIDTALDFDRVLVVEGGHIVEDAAPNQLLKQPDSRLKALHEAHEDVKRAIWENPQWRRWRMERGQLRQQDGEHHGNP